MTTNTVVLFILRSSVMTTICFYPIDYCIIHQLNYSVKDKTARGQLNNRNWHYLYLKIWLIFPDKNPKKQGVIMKKMSLTAGIPCPMP